MMLMFLSNMWRCHARERDRRSTHRQCIGVSAGLLLLFTMWSSSPVFAASLTPSVQNLFGTVNVTSYLSGAPATFGSGYADGGVAVGFPEVPIYGPPQEFCFPAPPDCFLQPPMQIGSTPAYVGFEMSPGFVLDPSATLATQTAGSINLVYNDAGQTRITLTGDPGGLQLANVQTVAHVDLSQGIASFSGTATLVDSGVYNYDPNNPYAYPYGITFYQFVHSLTGGTDRISFSGVAEGYQTGPSSGAVYFYDLTLEPILQSVSVLSGGAQTASLLGGAGATGGLQLSLNPSSTGTLAASYLRDTSGLSPAQLAALGNFQVGLEIGDALPQTWLVTYTGNPGSSIELTFTYDPTAFGANFDPIALRVAHFKNDGTVELLTPTSIDPVNNTISVTSTGFSAYALVTAVVPEPSTALLFTVGLVALAAGRRTAV